MVRNFNRQRFRRIMCALATLAMLGLVSGPAFAAKADKTVAKKVKPAKWPISGQASLGASAGIGTFVAGEQSRPSVSSSLSLFFGASLGGGFRLSVSQAINKTLVDFAENPFAARKRATTLGDTLLLLGFRPMMAADPNAKAKVMTDAEKAAAALNPALAASGGGKPLKLPGGIGIGAQLRVHLPTSRIAQYQTRQLVLGGAITLNKGGIGPLSFIYQVRFDKNFHKYSNAIVDYSDLNSTPLARPGGAEQVGDTLVATSFNNFSFGIRNLIIVSVSTPTKLSFQFIYLMINNFRYYDAPQDDFTSPNAKAGRGRLDLQFGQVSANYSLPNAWLVSLNTATFATPYMADNQRLNLPFLEFRNASSNITSVGLSLTKSF